MRRLLFVLLVLLCATPAWAVTAPILNGNWFTGVFDSTGTTYRYLITSIGMYFIDPATNDTLIITPSGITGSDSLTTIWVDTIYWQNGVDTAKMFYAADQDSLIIVTDAGDTVKVGSGGGTGVDTSALVLFSADSSNELRYSGTDIIPDDSGSTGLGDSSHPFIQVWAHTVALLAGDSGYVHYDSTDTPTPGQVLHFGSGTMYWDTDDGAGSDTSALVLFNADSSHELRYSGTAVVPDDSSATDLGSTAKPFNALYSDVINDTTYAFPAGSIHMTGDTIYWRFHGDTTYYPFIVNDTPTGGDVFRFNGSAFVLAPDSTATGASGDDVRAHPDSGSATQDIPSPFWIYGGTGIYVYVVKGDSLEIKFDSTGITVSNAKWADSADNVIDGSITGGTAGPGVKLAANTVDSMNLAATAINDALVPNNITITGLSDSTSWNTAYGWGDHAGLYVEVDGTSPLTGNWGVGDYEITGVNVLQTDTLGIGGITTFIYKDAGDGMMLVDSSGSHTLSSLAAGTATAFPDGTNMPVAPPGADGYVLKVATTPDPDSSYWAVLSGTGEVNTASNQGTGYRLSEPKNVYDLPFKTITSAGTVSLDTATANELKITGSAHTTAGDLDGAALVVNGAELDVQARNGAQINSDYVEVKPGDGIDTSGGTVTVKLDGATLTKSGSGLKVTDNTYSPLAGSSSLTTTGTVTSGTWGGGVSDNVIDPPDLNSSTPSVGDVPAYASATSWSWVTPSLSTHNHDATYGTLTGEASWSGTQNFTGATFIAESLWINDANTGIYEDVSGNLTFLDAVYGGTRTLSQLAAASGGAVWHRVDSVTVIDTTAANDTALIVTKTPAQDTTTISTPTGRTLVVEAHKIGTGNVMQLTDNPGATDLLAADSTQATFQSAVIETLTVSAHTALSGTVDIADDAIADSSIPNTITASNYLPLAGGTMASAANITFAGNGDIHALDSLDALRYRDNTVDTGDVDIDGTSSATALVGNGTGGQFAWVPSTGTNNVVRQTYPTLYIRSSPSTTQYDFGVDGLTNYRLMLGTGGGNRYYFSKTENDTIYLNKDGDAALSGTFSPTADGGAHLGTAGNSFGDLYAQGAVNFSGATVTFDAGELETADYGANSVVPTKLPNDSVYQLRIGSSDGATNYWYISGDTVRFSAGAYAGVIGHASAPLDAMYALYGRYGGTVNSGHLRLPWGNNPTLTTEHGIAADTNDAGGRIVMREKGSNFTAAQRYKMAAITVYDPDNHAGSDTLTIMPVVQGMFPHGISIDSVGFAQDTSLSLTATFLYTSDGKSNNTAIEAVTSSNREARNSSAIDNAAVGADYFVHVYWSATGTGRQKITFWIMYTVTVGS